MKRIITTAALWIVLALVLLPTMLWVVGETIEHFTPHPTADQLYGCTVKQQAPSGECP